MQLQANLQSELGKMRPFSAWLGIVCAFLFATAAFGQGVSGRLQGTIQDASGAVISGASVTVSNQDTGVVSKSTSDSRGDYRLWSSEKAFLGLPQWAGYSSAP